MEKIDISKIRGQWRETSRDGKTVAGGNDTIESMRRIGEKVNEIIEEIETIKHFTPGL